MRRRKFECQSRQRFSEVGVFRVCEKRARQSLEKTCNFQKINIFSNTKNYNFFDRFALFFLATLEKVVKTRPNKFLFFWPSLVFPLRYAYQTINNLAPSFFLSFFLSFLLYSQTVPPSMGVPFFGFRSIVAEQP